jgi:hypothetical protein
MRFRDERSTPPPADSKNLRRPETANCIKILKITLWASVIVAAVSLIYGYIKVYFVSVR